MNQKKTLKRSKSAVIVGWAAAAACLIFAAAAGYLIFSRLAFSEVTLGGVLRNYKNIPVTQQESMIIYPWEYLTPGEQYGTLVFAGREYNSRGRAIDSDLLEEKLGSADAYGYDTYTDREYRTEADVYRIRGVSENLMTAAQLGEEYIVYSRSEYDPPATFGELLDICSLAQMLSFERFTEYDGHTDKGHYRIDSDDYIWDILNSCRDAAFTKDDTWSRSDRHYLSFTATSEALGVYKRVFYVTADGYISTNIFDWGYIFFIGEDAAQKIMTYAKENCTKTEPEPYNNSLAGVLTKVGSGYILIDDSVLCANPKDGMIFKVSTDDLRISRSIDFEKIGVGDTVAVNFTGSIDVDAGNLVTGAYSLSKAIIQDGNAMIPE